MCCYGEYGKRIKWPLLTIFLLNMSSFKDFILKTCFFPLMISKRFSESFPGIFFTYIFLLLKMSTIYLTDRMVFNEFWIASFPCNTRSEKRCSLSRNGLMCTWTELGASFQIKNKFGWFFSCVNFCFIHVLVVTINWFLL